MVSLSKESAEISRMFDTISSHYDITNILLTFGQVFAWRAATKRAVNAHPGMTVLDVACGTGASTASLAKSGADITGCDFSAGMIREGLRRHPHLNLIQGDATHLPFDDGSFDVATMSYGLRNMSDPMEALKEMYRVVRPGGRVVVAEFSTPAFPPVKLLYHVYTKYVVPTVSKIVFSDKESYEYLHDSIEDWPNKERLSKMFEKAGWSDVRWRSLAFGMVAIHTGTKAE